MRRKDLKYFIPFTGRVQLVKKLNALENRLKAIEFGDQGEVASGGRASDLQARFYEERIERIYQNLVKLTETGEIKIEKIKIYDDKEPNDF